MQGKVKGEKAKRGFFSKMLDKLDKAMAQRARSGSSCCSGNKKGSKSCCS